MKSAKRIYSNFGFAVDPFLFRSLVLGNVSRGTGFKLDSNSIFVRGTDIYTSCRIRIRDVAAVLRTCLSLIGYVSAAAARFSWRTRGWRYIFVYFSPLFSYPQTIYLLRS
jgi:hypothetical protein